jgi:hypothetical protein
MDMKLWEEDLLLYAIPQIGSEHLCGDQKPITSTGVGLSILLALPS